MGTEVRPIGRIPHVPRHVPRKLKAPKKNSTLILSFESVVRQRRNGFQIEALISAEFARVVTALKLSKVQVGACFPLRLLAMTIFVSSGRLS